MSEQAEYDFELDVQLSNIAKGDLPNQYFVLAILGDGPGDIETVRTHVLRVTSLEGKIQWEIFSTFPGVAYDIKRVGREKFVVGTRDGNLIGIEKGKQTVLAGKDDLNSMYDIAVLEDGKLLLTRDTGLSYWDGLKLKNNSATARRVMYAVQSLSPVFRVAVGLEGVVFIQTDSKWRRVEKVPTDKDLTALLCVSEKEVYVGGWHGTLYRWDGGKKWQKIKVEGDKPFISSICEYKGCIYVCGTGHGIYRIEENKAVKVHEFWSSASCVVDGKLIIAGMNKIYEFDGKEWVKVEIEFDYDAALFYM